MWKLVVGFIVFAAVVLLVLSKAGGDVDMSGEKHGSEAAPAASEPASAAPAVPAAASAAVSTASGG